MTRLIYLSPVPWESFAQRPQKFVEWFHARTGAEVVWVDPYPTRLPRWSDLHRTNPERQLAAKGRPDWLRVLKPFALPVEPLPGSGWMSVFWQPILKDLEQFAAGHETQLVIGKPSLLALAVLRRLPGVPSVYDAMDEFPAFYAGISRWSFARREQRVVANVDALWVTSTRLKQHWSKVRPDLRLVPNALDDSLLPAPRDDNRKSQQKVFGYVGTIASWFDWDWVIALANARPGDVIRLIGPVFHPPCKTLPENIELLPGCHHEAALNAMRNFDVGLIPFLRNDLTASVDPIKYYEYRALGLPVISTKFGEMEFHAQQRGTFLAETPEAIGALAELALDFKDDAAAPREFAKCNSWAARFDATRLLP